MIAVDNIKEIISAGKAVLGIELGSTRIKAVLIGEDHSPIASGSHDWKNQYVNNIWTYSIDDIWAGIRESYKKLVSDVYEKYGVKLRKTASIGFSAMMHGYMAFDENANLLVPFRTWRNTMTQEASDALTELFEYPIPVRWSIAHLYQAILNNEEHVSQINYITTLSGYIHWMLTGEKVIGIGDASGMFPIDINKSAFNEKMTKQFDEKIADKNYGWKLNEILPKVLVAGDNAGSLTEEGARLLDPSGQLESGIPLCPPEGDAGTGMVATNSVAVRTGNVSAGTSIFAMIVLEKELSRVYKEIDLVTTPCGSLVGMVHCNNCTSDIDAWVNMFKEMSDALGEDVSVPKIYDTFYAKALEGDPDCGGLLSYGYYSGEPITGFNDGRPLFVHSPDSKFSLANFARSILFTTVSALKIGMDILLEGEKVKIDEMLGHGGLFKTKLVGQKIMAAALNAPVSVMETAGEGGPWGMAILASYMINRENNETLTEYLKNKVFLNNKGIKIDPDKKDIEGFNKYVDLYKAGFAIEDMAVKSI